MHRPHRRVAGPAGAVLAGRQRHRWLCRRRISSLKFAHLPYTYYHLPYTYQHLLPPTLHLPTTYPTLTNTYYHLPYTYLLPTLYLPPPTLYICDIGITPDSLSLLNLLRPTHYNTTTLTERNLLNSAKPTKHNLLNLLK